MKVGDLVIFKDAAARVTWNDSVGLVVAIEKQSGWKDHQAFVYWPNENKVWTFTVRLLKVINEAE